MVENDHIPQGLCFTYASGEPITLKLEAMQSLQEVYAEIAIMSSVAPGQIQLLSPEGDFLSTWQSLAELPARATVTVVVLCSTPVEGKMRLVADCGGIATD